MYRYAQNHHSEEDCPNVWKKRYTLPVGVGLILIPKRSMTSVLKRGKDLEKGKSNLVPQIPIYFFQCVFAVTLLKGLMVLSIHCMMHVVHPKCLARLCPCNNQLATYWWNQPNPPDGWPSKNRGGFYPKSSILIRFSPKMKHSNGTSTIWRCKMKNLGFSSLPYFHFGGKIPLYLGWHPDGVEQIFSRHRDEPWPPWPQELNFSAKYPRSNEALLSAPTPNRMFGSIRVAECFNWHFESIWVRSCWQWWLIVP